MVTRLRPLFVDCGYYFAIFFVVCSIFHQIPDYGLELWIIILMIEAKFVELIYNRVLVNAATIIFYKKNLVLNYDGLTKLGFLNLVTGFSIV